MRIGSIQQETITTYSTHKLGTTRSSTMTYCVTQNKASCITSKTVSASTTRNNSSRNASNSSCIWYMIRVWGLADTLQWYCIFTIVFIKIERYVQIKAALHLAQKLDKKSNQGLNSCVK